MKKKPNLPQKSFADIKAAWDKAQSMATKDKLKQYKTIANFIYGVDLKQAEADELEAYISMLDAIIPGLPSPQKTRLLLNRIRKQWMEISDRKEIAVLAKASGKVTTESASFIIGDASHIHALQQKAQNRTLDVSEKALLQWVNAHKLFIFTTGMDFTFDIQLRVVDGDEPMVTSKELSFVKDSSQLGVINAPTGEIAVADLSGETKPDKVSVPVEKGIYKIKAFAFHIPNKFNSFYIVLARTSDDNLKPLTSLDLLGL